MNSSVDMATGRLALLAALLALLGSSALPTLVEAQDTAGHNLILDTDRNRAPGEPARVLGSGGPTEDDLKRYLEQRIEKQSEGQITLFGLRQISTRILDLELCGRPVCAVEFELGIEVQSPGVWASAYRGRPLTFVLLKPHSDLQGADRWRPFRVEAKGKRFVMQGYALFTPGEDKWTLAGLGQTALAVRQSFVPDETSERCVTQMKQIGLAFRTWAIDHDDRYPFNVGTNAGGTHELCIRRGDGFDANAAAHFKAMSNELGNVGWLVCPGDTTKRPAIGFVRLQAANVSYLLRSGTKVDETNPNEVLARCPIHSHVLLADGTVTRGAPSAPQPALPPPSATER
jgi:hypothetical protein